MENQGIRINKYLSEAGVCSRREADRWCQDGLVTINGRVADCGCRVSPEDTVRVKGKIVGGKAERVLLAYHKPAGIVCTAEKREKNNIVDYMKYPVRIFPVGRLDKDSTGLLLLTNDGELVNKIMRAGNYHEKEYVVQVDRPVTEDFCRKMAGGVAILDTVTRPCKVKKSGEREFHIILTQGLNRQIRRMCETFGYRVTALHRIRIMNIQLKDLKVGTWRTIEGEELRQLEALLADSSSLPVRDRNRQIRQGR